MLPFRAAVAVDDGGTDAFDKIGVLHGAVGKAVFMSECCFDCGFYTSSVYKRDSAGHCQGGISVHVFSGVSTGRIVAQVSVDRAKAIVSEDGIKGGLPVFEPSGRGGMRGDIPDVTCVFEGRFQRIPLILWDEVISETCENCVTCVHPVASQPEICADISRCICQQQRAADVGHEANCALW